MTLLAFSRADDRDCFGLATPPTSGNSGSSCLRPTRKCQLSSPLQRRDNSSSAKSCKKTATYEELLQVAPLGYLQVDEENQLLCNEQARQLLSLQGGDRCAAELVRSYESRPVD